MHIFSHFFHWMVFPTYPTHFLFTHFPGDVSQYCSVKFCGLTKMYWSGSPCNKIVWPQKINIASKHLITSCFILFQPFLALAVLQSLHSVPESHPFFGPAITSLHFNTESLSPFKVSWLQMLQSRTLFLLFPLKASSISNTLLIFQEDSYRPWQWLLSDVNMDGFSSLLLLSYDSSYDINDGGDDSSSFSSGKYDNLTFFSKKLVDIRWQLTELRR